MLRDRIKISLLLLFCTCFGACNQNVRVSNLSGRMHSATLKWTASTSRVVGYRIYRSNDSKTPPGLLAVTGPTDTQYVDRGVEGGKTYYYSVKAFDAAGRESVPAMISATIPADSEK
jgi:fibronectin type 3 domain-containing protein